MFRIPALMAMIALSAAALLLYMRRDAVWPSLVGSSLYVPVGSRDADVLKDQYRWITNGQGRIVTRVKNTPLVLRTSRGGVCKSVEVEGRPDISAYLSPAFSRREIASNGLSASLIGVALAVLLLVNKNSIERFGLAFAFLGGFSTIPLGFNCLSGTSYAREGFVPLFALAGFGLSALVFLRPSRSLALYLAVAIFGTVGSIVQAILLTDSPKLCPWCLLMGCAGVGMAQAAVASIGRGSRVRQLRVSPRLSTSLMAILLFAFARGTLISLDICKIPAAKRMSFSMLGRPLQERYNGTPAPGLYMVTSLTCPSCQSAKAFNAESRLRVVEMPICSGLRTSECFSPGLEPVPTPTFFLVDSKGKVVWEYVGAPAPEEQNTFLNLLRSKEETHDEHP